MLFSNLRCVIDWTVLVLQMKLHLYESNINYNNITHTNSPMIMSVIW